MLAIKEILANKVVKSKSTPSVKLLIILSWLVLFICIFLGLYYCKFSKISFIIYSISGLVLFLVLRIFANIGEAALMVLKELAELRNINGKLEQIKSTLEETKLFFDELKRKIDVK
jgi:uncharacterized membrane protein YfhO